MTKIFWEKGDTFKVVDRYGIVLDNVGNTIVLTRLGNLEYKIERRSPPDGALPTEIETMPRDIQLALDTAAVAAGLRNSIQRSIRKHTLMFS
jgi:hypothetical protein